MMHGAGYGESEQLEAMPSDESAAACCRLNLINLSTDESAKPFVE
jgi:hypothetical protein